MKFENIKPGLYWCKPTKDHADWDCIAIVGGEPPFLNFSVFSIFFEKMLDKHTETSIVWGPRIEPPGEVEEIEIEDNDLDTFIETVDARITICWKDRATHERKCNLMNSINQVGNIIND